MKKLIIFSFGLFLSTALFTQNTFIKTYGGTRIVEGITILEIEDGDFLMAGNINDHDPWGNHIYLVRTNAHGDTLWTQCHDFDTVWGCANHSVHSMRAIHDGNYLLTVVFAAENMLVKINGEGEILWTENVSPMRDSDGQKGQYGFGLDFRQCPDLGFVINIGAYIVKTDSLGIFEWQYHVNNVYYSSPFLHELEISEQGLIVAAGYIYNPNAGTQEDIFAIAIDPGGNLLWDYVYEDPGTERCYSICETSDGFVLASTDGPFGGGNADIRITKLDYEGNETWNNTIDNEIGAVTYDIKSLEDGTFVLTGEENLNGKNYAMLYKLDAAATVLWKEFFLYDPIIEFHRGLEVIALEDGGYAVMGTTNDLNFSNMMLIRTDASGIITSVSEQEIEKPETLCSPNPFQHQTTIRFNTNESSNLSLTIADISGRVVYRSATMELPAGEQSFTWDGQTSFGTRAYHGTYFYFISNNKDIILTGKLIKQ